VSVTGSLVTARKSGGFARVYEHNAVPEMPEYPYVVVGYSPQAPEVRGLISGGTLVRWFTVQHFARTVDALEDVTSATAALFEGQPITGLSDMCDLLVASQPYRDPDDNGVLTITHTYRF